MAAPETDRNLLFGLLALQNHFIDRDALVVAFNAWVADKSHPLDQILVERGLISPDLHAVLSALAAKHEEVHQGDPRRSLVSTASIEATRDWLGEEYEGDPSPLRFTLASDAEPTETTVAGPVPNVPRFRVLRAHARGGLGQVFVARDEELHREVAFKAIRDEYADKPDMRARFVREAEITGRLEHPGVVPVYALGADAAGRPFYAMRFIRGESLRAAIARFHEADTKPGRDPGARALALRELLGHFLAACQTVAYAHSRGVLHRDLKPANIMLGPFGETLVVDWGLAKAIGRSADSERTPEGTLRPSPDSGSVDTVRGRAHGTPAYMPPEQATGDLDQLSPASDVYSLGATLFCLLTGQAPLQGEQDDVLRRAGEADFPTPGRVKPGVPPALEAICLKAMRRNPLDRYPRVVPLTDDLKHWLADEPVGVYPESPSRRLARWTRRHRAQTQAAAVALVAVTAVATLAYALTSKALLSESRALTLAQSNLGTARQAIMGLQQRLAEGELATLPQVGPLRVEVSNSAVGFMGRLLTANPSDVATRRDAAAVFRERANLARGRRDFTVAEADYGRAIDLLERLVAELGLPYDRASLASVLADSGESLRLANRRGEAAERLRQSLERLVALPATNPAEAAALKRREAAARVDLGDVLLDSGRVSESTDHYRRAADVLTPLTAVPKPELPDLWVLAFAWRGLGSSLAESQRTDEAATAFKSGARLLTGRDDLNSRFVLASIRSRHGDLLAPDPARRHEAEGLYDAAAGLLGPLVRDHPDRATFPLHWAAALNGRGGTRLGQGLDRNASAEADCRQALSTLEALAEAFADYPTYHSQLGTTLDNLATLERARGREAEARAFRQRADGAHAKACALNPDNPTFSRRRDDPRRRAPGPVGELPSRPVP